MVFSFGTGEKGQLGHGDKTNLTEPTMITALLNYRILDVVCGSEHNMGLGIVRDLTKTKQSDDNKSKDQLVFVWGDNSYGQLGISNSTSDNNNTNTQDNNNNADTPTYISTPKLLEEFSDKKISKIECGLYHSFILLDNGKLFGFGSNEFSQISIIKDKMILKPTRIKFSKNYIFTDIISSGFSNTLLTDNNFLILFGKISTKTKLIKLKEDYNLHEDFNFILNDNKLVILYDSAKIDKLVLQEYDLEEANHSHKSSIVSINDAEDRNKNLSNNYHTNQEILEDRLYQEFDISKDFFSDNASTNEIFYDNNISFEQSIEELRSYISLVGISFAR